MNKVRGRTQAVAIAACVAGLLLRLWFLRHAPLAAGDTLIYGGIARNWMTRGVYGFYLDAVGRVVPTLIRLPGYPLFLAMCFRLFGIANYAAVRYVQLAADLATCWLAGSTSRRLFGSRAGLVTLWLAALCPFTANYVAAPLTETLVLLTISTAFYSYVRWWTAGGRLNRWFWIISLTLAYSMLLRPDQFLLTVALIPAIVWAGRESTGPSTRSLTPAIVCLACVVLPLVPWTIRNWHTFHVLQPLAPRYANDPSEAPPLGFARWYRTWAIEFASTDSVYWNYNSTQIDPASLPERAFDAGPSSASDDLRRQTLDTLSRYNLTTTQTLQSESDFAALASTRIHAHPLDCYLLLPLARLADMVLRPRTEMLAVPMEWWRWRPHPRTSLFAAGYALLNLVYLALGLTGFLRWRRSGFATRVAPHLPALGWAVAASILLRCALLLTIDNAEPRYTLEFFPVLLICAGAMFVPRRQHAASAHN